MRILLLGLLALSCASNEYTEGPLKLHWKPPNGVKLESESTEGAVTTAHFSGGVEVLSVTAPAPSVDGDLDALKTTLMASSKLDLPGTTRVGRSGSIPAGPTVRWELESGGSHSLLYYVPSKDRYVLIALTAPAGAFDRKSDQMEMALSTLKLQ